MINIDIYSIIYYLANELIVYTCFFSNQTLVKVVFILHYICIYSIYYFIQLIILHLTIYRIQTLR